ncbi:hypothetical protein [Caballeronia telluris]|nr:hypothetical protein [Caballeronia telluris]
MPAVFFLDQELAHIDGVVRRLIRLAEHGQMDHSTAVVSRTYWRRRIEEVVHLSNGERELLQRASALLRAVDQLPDNEVW